MAKTKQRTMNGHDAKRFLAAKKPETAGYKPFNHAQWFQRPRDLPPFSFSTILAMLIDPTLRLGLAMRAAPLFAAEFAYKEGEKWIPGVQADSEVIAAFVQRQLDRIWKNLDSLVQAQIWGWAACEVQYRLTPHGMVELDRLLPRHSNDTRALSHDGEVCGVRFLRIHADRKAGNDVDLFFPKCIYHAHAPEPGCEYGMSILQGAYSPWADKWLNGGALDVRRLFMHKDAYGGADLGYPEGTINIEGKGDIPCRDIAREIVEQMQSGAVTTRPSTADPVTGKERWPLTRAVVPANPQHILQYPKDLDVEELRGMEIPDEVFMPSDAGTTGYSGKSIPMQGFYTGLDRWLVRLIGDLRRQVLEPLVLINYGKGRFFDVTAKPLGLQAMEQQGQGKSSQPQQTFIQQPRDGDGDGQRLEGQQPPQRMSLDPVEAVGEGVLSAAELVKAARTVIATRLSTDTHSYSSTQFNLPGELAYEVRRLGESIPADDLAEDGRESDPHVTIKYGLHTDDAEDVRSAVFGESPIAIQLGPASYFAGDGYDVVKIDVQSKGLHALNARICEALPHTDTYPDYKPHVTVAYVKSGLGEKYAATLNALEGRTAVFDRMVFSDKQRNWVSIPLTGKAVRFSTDASGQKNRRTNQCK